MALVDRFLPPAAFAALLAREPQLADVPFATARADMDRLLDQAVAASRAQRAEDVEDALFAVCAFADEAVLSSQWPGRHEWLKKSLQRERFGTVNAGEEFYERLAALKARVQAGQGAQGALFEEEDATGRVRGVLEIYAACLTMGFTGRYYGQGGREELSSLTRESLDRLLVRGPDLDGRLFPEAYARRGAAEPPRRLVPALKLLALLGVPLATAVYLHAAYASLLAAWARQWLGHLN
ncbi:type VI secretion system protein ImpK [Humidesulfovibrio mexicanus]|uniref:Type VI secretion system protein ImpK n=1 Tax=Humidesulfovibrio mexicanus TaxID=147047 RepID=A0A239A251_9BACT|nr:DotU family type IV/VI secretion system protein [Humidesulfovibrio mexicanus]SNR89640.1 type VI secretion system protein ImpK [Humidesulfovibrio mexicanus]